MKLSIYLFSILFALSCTHKEGQLRKIASNGPELVNWRQKDYPDSCTSGKELGINLNIKTQYSNNDFGGRFSFIYMKIEDGKYYEKIIGNKRIEVTDNLFEKDLETKYPFLKNGASRPVEINVSEDLPQIAGLKYQKDEFDEYMTPKRTWNFKFFAHDGNQRLMITDNPLKVIKNSKGKAIEYKEVDSPKYMKSFEFFPRKYVTHLEFVPDRKNPEEAIVTLTNGEEVVFDAKTGDIIRGVFKKVKRPKSKHTQIYKHFNRYYHQDQIEYIGSGVWIEVNESEKTGFSRRAKNKQGQKIKVVVRKHTGESCEVYSEDLWGVNLIDGKETVASKNGQRSTSEDYIKFKKAQGIGNPSKYGHLNTAYKCYKFKFKSDELFDKYLKNKCGFGFL